MPCVRCVVSVAVLVSLFSPAPAESRIALRRVATLDQPMQVLTIPGERNALAIVQRRGRVRILRQGRVVRRPLADLSRVVGIRSSQMTADHGGLFSIAFAPDYPVSRRLYAFYTHRDESLRIEELTRGVRRVLLRVPDRHDFDLGGQIAFGPGGLLYAGLGDQDVDGAAQDPGDLRGKLLRIRPARPGATWKTFALGLRNPFRFSFSPRGTLLVGDVGEATAEEISVIPRGRVGANLGWDVFEGRERVRGGGLPGALGPAVQLRHSAGYCSITGGLLVRDGSSPLYGRYVYSDFCRGRLRSTRILATRARGDRAERIGVTYPVGFGEDARRRVYVVSLRGGVYRLVRR